VAFLVVVAIHMNRIACWSRGKLSGALRDAFAARCEVFQRSMSFYSCIEQAPSQPASQQARKVFSLSHGCPLSHAKSQIDCFRGVR
jgi:hypothetical protein